eukprot:6191932-Pleurochrysis_carterae.AAC.2
MDHRGPSEVRARGDNGADGAAQAVAAKRVVLLHHAAEEVALVQHKRRGQAGLVQRLLQRGDKRVARGLRGGERARRREAALGERLGHHRLARLAHAAEHRHRILVRRVHLAARLACDGSAVCETEWPSSRARARA